MPRSQLIWSRDVNAEMDVTVKSTSLENAFAIANALKNADVEEIVNAIPKVTESVIVFANAKVIANVQK